MFWRAGKLPEQAKVLADRVSDPELSTLRVIGMDVDIPVEVNHAGASIKSAIEEAKPLSSAAPSEHSIASMNGARLPYSD